MCVITIRFVKEVSFDDAHTDAGGEPLQSVALTDEELRTRRLRDHRHRSQRHRLQARLLV